MLTTFTQEVWGAKTLAITSSRPTYSAITGKAIAMSEQSNDSKDRKYTLTGGKLAPTPTDTNTSFKEEAEKIFIEFETYLMTVGIDGINRDQALASIINLVDKEVIGEDDKDVRGTTQNPDNPIYHTKRTKFNNELRAEQRAIIRGSDEKDM